MGKETTGAAAPEQPGARSGRPPGHPLAVRFPCTGCFFVGLSFPTAGITRKFRASMADALQSDSATSASVREQYRETIAPQIRGWSILSANYGLSEYSFSALFKAPEYYFAFEIIGFSAVLAVLISRLKTAHRHCSGGCRQPLSTAL